jgi:hypothetical protein
MRTLHGLLIDSLMPHEREHWLRRYTECLADAWRRGDASAARMYEAEVAKLARA